MKQNDNLNKDNEIIKQLHEDLEQARIELQTKNQQIAKFQLLLDQQQQLNLSSQKLLESKNDTTQSRENDSKDDKSNSDTNTNKQNEKPSNKTKENFWKRLFR